MRISGWSMSRWSESRGKLTHQSGDASQGTGTGAKTPGVLLQSYAQHAPLSLGDLQCAHLPYVNSPLYRQDHPACRAPVVVITAPAGGTLLPPPRAEEVEQPYHMTIIFDGIAWRQHG
jgi:hypothetical protein